MSPTGADGARVVPYLKTAVPGPESLRMAARLARLESPDTTCFSDDFPIFWHRASGATVEDVDGNRYIDMNAGFGVAAVGHSHPSVVAAIAGQSATLVHAMGDVHPNDVKLRLCEALAEIAPGSGDWKMIFGVTGSDSVEAALKTAALATGHAGVITFEGGYHGVTLGALAVTAWPKSRLGFEAFISDTAVQLPFPGLNVEPSGKSGASGPDVAIQTVESVLDQVRATISSSPPGKPRIGAILIEPILGRGGIVRAAPEFLRGLRGIADETGTLLIFDEIYTGMGRTGRWFACEHDNVIPDLLLIGKALGGGMPISVCMGRTDVIDAWGRSAGEARHTSTFLGHPLACASALAVIGAIRDDGLLQRAQTNGEYLLARLRKQFTKDNDERSAIAEIRGHGMMVGIELRDPETGEPDGALAWAVVVEALHRGVIALVSGMQGHVLSLTPPFVIETEQIERAVSILVEAFDAAQSRRDA